MHISAWGPFIEPLLQQVAGRHLLLVATYPDVYCFEKTYASSCVFSSIYCADDQLYAAEVPAAIRKHGQTWRPSAVFEIRWSDLLVLQCPCCYWWRPILSYTRKVKYPHPNPPTRAPMNVDKRLCEKAETLPIPLFCNNKYNLLRSSFVSSMTSPLSTTRAVME